MTKTVEKVYKSFHQIPKGESGLPSRDKDPGYECRDCSKPGRWEILGLGLWMQRGAARGFFSGIRESWTWLKWRWVILGFLLFQKLGRRLLVGFLWSPRPCCRAGSPSGRSWGVLESYGIILVCEGRFQCDLVPQWVWEGGRMSASMRWFRCHRGTRDKRFHYMGSFHLEGRYKQLCYF